jgi:hypothetical protein
MREATRIASRGGYKCCACGRVGAQHQGLIVAMLGNVLLSICPPCVDRPIVITRKGNSIDVRIDNAESRVVLASDLSNVSTLVAASPDVKKLTL